MIKSMIPPKQRALVLQGGGAIGAYEVGVFKVLYHWINNQIGEDENIFDVIAGTSAGAINGALLLNYVLVNKRNNPSIGTKQCWAGSPKMLWNFWVESSTETTIDNPLFENWWKMTYGMLPGAASSESARRYYSTKELLFTGTRNVFSSPAYISDNKYFDNFGFLINNGWYRYNNLPLQELIRKYWDYEQYPIKTSFENKEPRLLLATVDVENGKTVTFDSYARLQKDEDGKPSKNESNEKIYRWKTSYDVNNPSAVEYDGGIDVRHVIASASVPVHYDYTVLEDVSHKERRFWDGGLISNTPLRELVSEYKTFWEDAIGEDILENDIVSVLAPEEKWRVPDLDVYVANIWPTSEIPAPSDNDGQIDRHNDITFHDKTEYDEKVSIFVTDYIDLTNTLIDRFVKTEADSSELKHILSMPALSKKRNGKSRRYKDLLIGRFRLTNVVRIERQDDPDTISRKWADYSLTSLQILYEQGRRDTLNRIIGDEFKKDLDSLKLEREVRGELGSLLDDLTQTLCVNSTDLIADMKAKLSGFINKVMYLNQNAKISDNDTEQISRRAESLKSSLED
jgi:NTE family protein